jgi:hypothetical protein
MKLQKRISAVAVAVAVVRIKGFRNSHFKFFSGFAYFLGCMPDYLLSSGLDLRYNFQNVSKFGV